MRHARMQSARYVMHAHHGQRGDDDEAERAVDDQRVEGDQGEADEAGDEADLQLLRAEGRRDRCRS